MKKLIVILLCLLSFHSKGQFNPIFGSGSATTLNYQLGASGANIGFVFKNSFGDTTAANVGTMYKNTPGLMIRVGNQIWYRNNNATAWIQVNGGAGATDTWQQTLVASSTLTQNNNVEVGNFALNFDRGANKLLHMELSVTGIYSPDNSKSFLLYNDSVTLNGIAAKTLATDDSVLIRMPHGQVRTVAYNAIGRLFGVQDNLAAAHRSFDLNDKNFTISQINNWTMTTNQDNPNKGFYFGGGYFTADVDGQAFTGGETFLAMVEERLLLVTKRGAGGGGVRVDTIYNGGGGNQAAELLLYSSLSNTDTAAAPQSAWIKINPRGIRASGIASGNGMKAVRYNTTTKELVLADTTTGSSGTIPISSLTAAVATNNINNLSYTQQWNWNSLDNDFGLILNSTSTAAASGTQKLLVVTMDGANSNSGQATTAAHFVNAHTGTTSVNTSIYSAATDGETNIAGQFIATGGSNDYAIIVPDASGFVGIGTSNPIYLLHVSGAPTETYVANIEATNAAGNALRVETADDDAGVSILNVLANGVPMFEIKGSGAAWFGNDAGSTGEVLISQGTGAPPIWGAASGGGSPAGNYGNVQLNRNGAFATPGSDSLDFDAGLVVKGIGMFSSEVYANLGTDKGAYGLQSAGNAYIMGTTRFSNAAETGYMEMAFPSPAPEFTSSTDAYFKCAVGAKFYIGRANRINFFSDGTGIAIGNGYLGASPPSEGLIVEGKTGIGTNSPDSTLTVVGSLRASTNIIFNTLAGTGSRAVLADANGNLSAPVSDKSIKRNIKSLDYGLEEIMKLKPVSFEYKKGWENFGAGKQIGFIAQDLQKVLPELVFMNTGGISDGKLGFRKEDLTPVIISALQEMQKEIEALQKEVKRLKKKR